MATPSFGAHQLELRALSQGFCYLRTTSFSSSTPSSTSPAWLKRFAIILEYGLVFFDPEAGRGALVDKIRGRDMRGVRLLPQDPSGCTLEIAIAPLTTLQVHLSTTNVTKQWLDILLHVATIPDFAALPLPQEGRGSIKDTTAFQHRASQRRGTKQSLVINDQPSYQPREQKRLLIQESASNAESKVADGFSGCFQSLTEQYDAEIKFSAVDSETKRSIKHAQSVKMQEPLSEFAQPSRPSHDRIQQQKASTGHLENVRRLSRDVSMERKPITPLNVTSLVQDMGPTELSDDPDSALLSLSGGPESGTLMTLKEGSSDGSLGGLTLTLESIPIEGGIAQDGFGLLESLNNSFFLKSELSDVTSKNESPSNLPAEDSASYLAQQYHIPTAGKELRASLQEGNKYQASQHLELLDAALR
ncbi:hypothetical protein L7F22_015482 [Adiantum nelumboides]|nr:hypothetical protein [Adiantum nelumboides]